LHVANFLGYVDRGDYNNSFIHRTRAFNPTQPLNFDLFAQGGSFKVPLNSIIDSNPIIPQGTVVNEYDEDNGLSNTPGALAAARGSPVDSASSGWFINQSDNSDSFDPGPYTIFGQVTSGMDIVDSIPFLPNAQQLQGTAFESTPFINGNLVIVQRVARIPILAGDYDFNGAVNAADYIVWRANYGSTTHAASDGNGNGRVDAADFIIWRNNRTSGSAAGVFAVPEPNAVSIVFFAAILISPALLCRKSATRRAVLRRRK
jgi:cyclophilin family peptidyl-prolyl cis-trans isomerase